MTKVDREKIAALTSQSLNLREVWQRERKLVLSAQLEENAQVKKRWESSDPIEVSQRQSVNKSK
jgi:hypothetical protein